jgi:anion-transporting  ArsA/GET3 family ATPase
VSGPLDTAPDRPTIESLVRTQRIIVCCGAGGVGKTTTAAALALAGARLGRRVLVLTIDPSRRLAETLGVARNPPKPVTLPADRLRQAEIVAPATLEAWMLDPKLVSDESVRRILKNPVEADRVLSNRIYQHVTQMVAGMHEYTAMEALHRFVDEGRYDLVILDTPPSRHALDFLEAPGRLARFLDGKIFQLFLPKEGGLIRRAASSLVHRVLRGVFGEDFAGDLTVFFSTFSGIFGSLNRDVSSMRAFLSQPHVAFLLVTSPAPAALMEALFFQNKTVELGLPFRGFVLNRSQAYSDGKTFPDESILPDAASAEARTALAKLRLLAHSEQEHADHDRALLRDLAARAGANAVSIALPTLPQGADDMGTLLTIAGVLLRS